MKRALLALIVTLLSTWAVAQTSSTPADPPQNASPSEPNSSMRDSSTEGTGNYSNGSDDDKLQMKACVAREHQANPQLSESELQRKCAKLKPKGEESH